MLILTIQDTLNNVFKPAVSVLEKVFFWDLASALGFNLNYSVPFVVVWLILGGVFFTLKMRFINITGFIHAIGLVTGKYDNPNSKGEVSHFQALTTALSATVGLGNIAGVAIAISVGGPGATFWMMIAGFLGMSLKFTECTLGVKYRRVFPDGTVSGGPMYYLEKGLAQKGFKRIGKGLAILYAILIVLASFGGGNMLQSNQAYSQLAEVVPFFDGKGLVIGVFLAISVGLVIIGGLKTIARVTSKVVPVMAILYVGCALYIIGVNFKMIDEVVLLIIRSAFNTNAIGGGVVGVLITGFRRGAFSNEAGIGSASIAHSAAKTEIPIREGLVGLLEPFIDTVVICTMTALVIIFTGVYQIQGIEQGAPLTSKAFGSVLPWFPYLLVVAIFLFAYSTMISWSYYGLKGFNYLFSGVISSRKLSGLIYQFIFLFFVILGSTTELYDVIEFSDMMILGLAFPNLLGLYFFSSEIRNDLKVYFKSRK